MDLAHSWCAVLQDGKFHDFSPAYVGPDEYRQKLMTVRYLKPAKVLDCFTHTGSFALNAGIAGSKKVLGVDASQLAVDQATENSRLNGLEDHVTFQCADVFDLLPKLEQEGEKFDVVILDPPAFTKSRNSIKNAVKGYREINMKGLKLVKDGAIWQPVPVLIL